MKTYQRLALIVLLSWTIIKPCSADDFGQAYFMTDKAFALDPIRLPGSAKYRIATFVPPGTLVFRLRTSPVLIDGLSHVTVVTEHGEHLLVPTSAVSSVAFSQRYGNQTIIFHWDSWLCPAQDKSCIDQSADSIDVPRGRVFQDVSAELDPVTRQAYLQLRTFDSKGLPAGDAYIARDRFSQLRSQAVLSDTSIVHPRFDVIQWQKLGTLSNRCGEKRKTINATELAADLKAGADIPGLFGMLTKVAGIRLGFEAQAQLKRTGETEIAYGADGFEYDVYRLELRVYDTDAMIEPGNKVRTIFVTTVAKCAGSAPIDFPVYIENVTVREESADGIVAVASFDEFNPHLAADREKLNKSLKIYQNNGHTPFLTSITSRQTYADIFKTWTDKVGDGSIAAILMNVLNASCSRQVVGGVASINECERLLYGR
jgi:hypothetical protein